MRGSKEGRIGRWAQHLEQHAGFWGGGESCGDWSANRLLSLGDSREFGQWVVFQRDEARVSPRKVAPGWEPEEVMAKALSAIMYSNHTSPGFYWISPFDDLLKNLPWQ